MTDQPKTRTKGGKPRKYASDAKRPTLTFRVRGGLHEKLKVSSEQNELSISEEIERRLEHSFNAADQSDGLKLALRAVERTWQFLEERISDQWADREPGKAAMRQAMLDVIDFGFPAKSREEMSDAERVEVDQLLSQVDAVTEMITWRKTDPQKAFPDNRLLKAANRPMPFTEAHKRWRKQQAAEAES